MSEPTPTALAAKAFMDRIGNDTYLRVIRTNAVNGGWVGARAAGCRDAKLSDAIAEAAVNSVLDLFREWAAEAVASTCPCCSAAPYTVNDCNCPEGGCGVYWCQAVDPDMPDVSGGGVPYPPADLDGLARRAREAFGELGADWYPGVPYDELHPDLRAQWRAAVQAVIAAPRTGTP